MTQVVKQIDLSDPGFSRGLRKLPQEIQAQAKAALKDLMLDPIPARIRFEKLAGYKNPAIYTIHLTPNHSHKASFELIGNVAYFRRIGTHKEIDRKP